MNENNILATVLAGGKSSRFGTDKIHFESKVPIMMVLLCTSGVA